MIEVEKHCNTCEHAYRPMEQHPNASGGRKTQCCASQDYNSDNYNHEMLMEDWDKGYCRFWTPRKRKDKVT